MCELPMSVKLPLHSAILLVVALTLSAGFAVAQTPPTAPPAAGDPNVHPGESADRAAERLNEDGKKLVAAGKYEEALDKFRASLKLFPLSNAIFNIGSMLYTLKQYEDAHPYLEQTLKAPLDPRQREIVLSYLENVTQALKLSHAPILVESNPPGATVTVNTRELPFVTPTRVMVPFGVTDITVQVAGFKPQTAVVTSSRQNLPKDVRVRLERDEPDAQMSVRCPQGADVFIDGTMRGFELVRDRMLLGNHVVRCGKTMESKAFERSILIRAGANAFDFSNITQ
jgi:hypothetical protein